MAGKGMTWDAAALPAPEGIRMRRGRAQGAGRRFGLVVSRFNEAFTGALLRSAVRALTAHGVAPEAIEAAQVPGAFEIPLAIERWAGAGRFDALIALGCIVEGETPHAALIAGQVTRALSEISLRHGVPVIDGVVAARTEAQAQARCRPGREGRGWHAGLTALEMADLVAELERRDDDRPA